VSTPKYHLEQIFDPQRVHPDDEYSILMRQIPPNSRVLELGCASGYLSGFMEQRLGCRVTGLEFDPATVVIATEQCSETHVSDLDAPDALDPAHTNALYDVLLAAAVLEHLKYPERLLRDAKPLLSPAARMIVSLPNIAHWSMRLPVLMGRFDYTDYGIMDRTHLHFYKAKNGHALLEDQGYPVEALYIAGSGLQNTLNRLARSFKRKVPAPILPGLLAYELIFVAHLAKELS